MTIELTTLFFLYPLVFLAVIFLAWLSAEWSRKKSELRSMRYYICSYCGAKIRDTNAAVHIRCSACGARNKIRDVQEASLKK